MTARQFSSWPHRRLSLISFKLLGQIPDLPVIHTLLTSRSEAHICETDAKEEVRPLVCEIPIKTSGEWLASKLLPGTEYKLYDLILSICVDPKQAYLHLSVVAALAGPLPISLISDLLCPGQGRGVETTLVQLRSLIFPCVCSACYVVHVFEPTLVAVCIVRIARRFVALKLPTSHYPSRCCKLLLLYHGLLAFVPFLTLQYCNTV